MIPKRSITPHKNKAAPVLQYRGGKVENGLPTNFSISILQNLMEEINMKSELLKLLDRLSAESIRLLYIAALELSK